MTGKEALESALAYYIISNGGTKYDSERKVEIARGYLRELGEMECVTNGWIRDRGTIMQRVILNRRLCIEKHLKDWQNDPENDALREEHRILYQAALLFKDFVELPL